jgi:hypothetical protein
MGRSYTKNDLSDLEQDIELQMEDRSNVEDQEFGRVLEDVLGGERDEEQGYADDDQDAEVLQEFGGSSDYVERFMELSRRPYESEVALDNEVNRIFHEIERDFFFKKLGGWLKKGLGGLKRIGKKALGFGRKLLKSPLSAFKGLTNLARGNLGGLLKSLAKTAISGLVPGGAALAPALSALGLEAEAGDPDYLREFWRRYVTLCEVAYERLAEGLDTDADDPAVAGRVAQEAFQGALREVFAEAGRSGIPVASRTAGKVRRFRVAATKGDVIVIRVT